MGDFNNGRQALNVSVLVVDLDDTLVCTNTLFDLLLKCLREKPFLLVSLLFELLRSGRSGLKRRLSNEFYLDVGTLPYRYSILEICQVFKARSPGHKLVLASAADQQIVDAVSSKLNLFDISIGSAPGRNLKSNHKLQAIRGLFADQKFAYAGDSKDDLAVWKESSHAILVNPTQKIVNAVKAMKIPHDIIEDRPKPCRLILKQLRVHQWVKNILICVPFLAAHKLFDAESWLAGITAFCSFSLFASAVYVLNDLVDLESDRKHPTKCQRPFASGSLSLQTGFIVFPTLLVGAFALALFLPWKFLAVAIGYLGLNLLYSFVLKEKIIIDVILLGSFYTMRILAGGYATEVELSSWLLSFSTFFFFGLAMVKRYTEILKLETGISNPFGRGYRKEDALPVFILGVVSSQLAMLVLSLYFNSTEVANLYSHAKRMWLLFPLLLFWTSRLWLISHRGEICDDPVVFTIRDLTSWVTGLLLLTVLILSL